MNQKQILSDSMIKRKDLFKEYFDMNTSQVKEELLQRLFNAYASLDKNLKIKYSKWYLGEVNKIDPLIVCCAKLSKIVEEDKIAFDNQKKEIHVLMSDSNQYLKFLLEFPDIKHKVVHEDSNF